MIIYTLEPKFNNRKKKKPIHLHQVFTACRACLTQYLILVWGEAKTQHTYRRVCVAPHSSAPYNTVSSYIYTVNMVTHTAHKHFR